MAQVRALCAAWRWAPSDRILHALPLHHVHGVVNALYCALHAGAAVEFMPRFSPGEAWQALMVRGRGRLHAGWGVGSTRVSVFFCWARPGRGSHGEGACACAMEGGVLMGVV